MSYEPLDVFEFDFKTHDYTHQKRLNRIRNLVSMQFVFSISNLDYKVLPGD